MSTEPRSPEPLAEQLARHTAFLTRLARPLVGDEHRVEDVVQEAYVLALERPPRERRSLRAWLAVVVSNLARNERRGSERRETRERVRAREEQEEPGALGLETLELQRTLIELVVALAEEQRRVLYLRYYEDLTPSAIAERLAVPVKTVKARHTRALAELRARLDARSGGDRREWISALLPVLGSGGRSENPSARRLRVPRSTQLALGIAATLVAVIAWSTLERSSPRPRGAEEAATAAHELAPTATARATLPIPMREPAAPAPESSPATQGSPPSSAAPAAELTLVIEVDLARVRELGWAREGASDAELVEAAAAVVGRRCRSLGRSVRALADADLGRIELVSPALDARERELFEAALRDLGLCEFLFLADDVSLAGLDIDLPAEQQKLALWRGAHPELSLAAFDALDPAQGGPDRRLTWVQTRYGDRLGAEMPLLLPMRLDDHLGAASFARVSTMDDPFGYPALWFEVLSSRWDDLTRITKSHVGQRMAAVIGGRIRSAPTLDWQWIGGGLIEGRFKDEELARLCESFRKLEGPLRIVETR